MKKITFILLSFLLTTYVAFSANLYLIANNGSTWTSTPTGFDNVYKVDLSNSGTNGTTAVTLTQWLSNRNAATPTYLINGSAGATFASTDQVWIAGGTYNVTGVWSILSGSGSATPSKLYGGFAGNENTTADRVKGSSAWSYTNETVINGSGSSTGILNAGGDRTMVIDGITFTACPNNAGQAIFQRPNMTIQNCKFTANSCVAVRYFISTASKTASTSSSYFANNTYTVSGGAEGGCIMANNGSAGGTYTISDCEFDSNSCSASGSGASAGIKAQGAGNVEIQNCIFKNNNATAGNSSAVSLTSATCTLKNSLIYGTSLATNKVALYVTAGKVTNCTVVNNQGGGAYLSNASTSTIYLTNNVFWGEDVKSGQVSAVANCLGTISNCAYTSLSANYIGTVSNTVDLTVSSTGLFTDPTNNVWSLTTASPLINMGTDLNAPASDLIGTPRPQGSAHDIGAYEYTSSTAASVVRTAANIVTVLHDGVFANKDGRLFIYNTSGQVINNMFVIAGEKINLRSGIYFIRLESDKGISSQKIIL